MSWMCGLCPVCVLSVVWSRVWLVCVLSVVWSRVWLALVSTVANKTSGSTLMGIPILNKEFK